MKLLLPLLIALSAWSDTPTPPKTYERGIDHYHQVACKKAKTLARERYRIIDIDPGCRCEHNDNREWQCDVGFTHSGPIEP